MPSIYIIDIFFFWNCLSVCKKPPGAGSFYSLKWIAWETAAYKASESINSQKKTESIWFSNYLLDIVGWLLFKPHLNANRVQIIQGKLNRFLQTSARSSHVFYKKRYFFKFRKIYKKHLCWSPFLIKERLWHRCFPVKYIHENENWLVCTKL